MKKVDLVLSLKKRIIEDALIDFQKTLETAKVVTDPAWKGILPIYNNLTKEQRTNFLRFMRTVQINCLSRTLGIIDGTSTLEGLTKDFVLTYEGEDSALNGSLQEDFLTLIENSADDWNIDIL